MIINGLGQTTIPKSVPATHAPGVDLSSRRLSALMNVLVFSPYAIYLARGKMPPVWLIAASLAWTGINFFDDLKYLIQGEETIEAELLPAPPTLAGLGHCGCHGLAAQPTPRPRPRTAQDAWRYRVNR